MFFMQLKRGQKPNRIKICLGIIHLASAFHRPILSIDKHTLTHTYTHTTIISNHGSRFIRFCIFICPV